MGGAYCLVGIAGADGFNAVSFQLPTAELPTAELSAAGLRAAGSRSDYGDQPDGTRTFEQSRDCVGDPRCLRLVHVLDSLHRITAGGDRAVDCRDRIPGLVISA